MKTWVKVVLIVTGASIASMAIVGVLGYRWFQRNKGELIEMSQKAKADGEAFGAHRAPSACTEEAVRRLRALEGMTKEVANKMFLGACLGAAEADATFCTDVPSSHDILRGATWAVGRCVELEMGEDQRCGRLMREIQEHCEKLRPAG